jgi:urea carboxylase-associated protein 2
MLWEDELRGGAHWSAVIRRGVVLRLTAQGDDANVAAMFYSREQPLERYNMADTLKAQHLAHLTSGCVCYSDMGRILCSITADTCGWHDPLSGLTDAALIAARYGSNRFQEQRNDRYVSGREGMLIELGKYGLGERDLTAAINFFSKVAVDEAGTMRRVADHCKSGQFVELRFEMDTLVLLHAGPHPLATASHYAPPAIGLQARRAQPVATDDPCRTRCPENARGFINTERHCSS